MYRKEQREEVFSVNTDFIPVYSNVRVFQTWKFERAFLKTDAFKKETLNPKYNSVDCNINSHDTRFSKNLFIDKIK